MPKTHAIPVPPVAEWPPPHPGRAAPRADDRAEALDGPPTIRVPAVCPVASDGPPLPSPAVTPPPLGALPFSCSVWSASGEDDVPRARRHPTVGDTLFGFKLVAELGRGAFARVFLAHQEALADRPVAVKVTLRPTREAQRLARLQHTNVVPVYSVHDADSVQAICMPYLGRTTLADLVRAYRVAQPAHSNGLRSTSARAARTTAYDSKSGPSKADSKGSGGDSGRFPVWTWEAEGPPPIVGDPHAVLQLLSQLAAGLAHAHERKILHLDLKPANVLLADTGEPMLLDFNLSYDAGQAERDLVGGTMPYMAIEQLRDVRDRGKGRIDERTDLYALGVLAYELLTGATPFASAVRDCRNIDGQIAARLAGPPPLRPRNPDVSPAVEAIVRMLLAPNPDDRYQSAYDLRTDLDRQLSDRPLKFARVRSARERLAKWRRRNPRLPYRAAVAGLVTAVVGFGAFAQHKAEANARSEAVQRAKEVRGAFDALRLDLVLPGDSRTRARGVKRAADMLAEYGLPDAADWQRRAAVRRLPAAERAALAGDLGELLALAARARWHGAVGLPDDERAVRAAEVWKLTAAARGCFAPGAVPAALDRFAATVAPHAGETFDPPPPDPDREPDARELFLDAAFALNEGRYAGATEALERATALREGHGAAQFCLAYCRQQQGQFQRAIERYNMAGVRLGDDSRPAHQRGLIYAAQRRPDRAEAEFTKALALDPEYADAYRHRALARFHLGRGLAGRAGAEKAAAEKFAAAEADLTAALRNGATPLFVHLVRQKVRAARGDRTGAAADEAAAAEIEPRTEEDYVVRGWARMLAKNSTGARADYERALELNHRSLVALQNLAHVLGDQLKDAKAALAATTKLTELYPEFGPALAGHALVLARLGRRDEAHEAIRKAQRVSEDPEMTYHAATVFALTSAKNAADRPEAIKLLRRAVNDRHNADQLASDADLDPIRTDPQFVEIQQAAKALFR